MVGIDTNVLVRYLTQDDPKQSAIATRYIEEGLSAENPGFVSTVTLCEIAWVLATSYGADRKGIRRTIENLLATRLWLSSERSWSGKHCALLKAHRLNSATR